MKFLKIFIFVAIVLASYYFYLTGGFLKMVSYFDSSLKFPNLSLESFSDVKEKSKEFFPEPLIRKNKDLEGKTLSSDLILVETNRHRLENGLPALALNSKLALAAKAKTEDMFKNQYFEHDSLSGEGASELVTRESYSFIVVGENLAMGHFKDENDLVTAWMNSPGHRANILGGRFKEVGIFVSRGEYKGDTVWMSVQEFATNESLCQKPFESDKREIAENIDALEDINKKLKDLKQEISIANKNDPGYNKLIESYNAFVAKYNERTVSIKNKTEKYNIDVRIYNQCIAQFTD